MTGVELLALACKGALLALAVRFLLNLDIELHWTALLGMISLIVQPWLSAQVSLVGATLSQLQFFLSGGAMTVALLGAAQVLHDL